VAVAKPAPGTKPGVDVPDDRDLDDGGLDLSPRTTGGARPVRRHRKRGAIVLLAVLLIAAGFLIRQALATATQFYYNADEAVQKRDDLGTKRFRVQGTVIDDPRPTADAIVFTIAFNGKRMVVRHTGSEPPLFKKGIPVVCEGHWETGKPLFDSERILVKHTESYKKANPDRVGSDKP
jgi:cytochrome c-type biogenesis protein CcmE